MPSYILQQKRDTYMPGSKPVWNVTCRWHISSTQGNSTENSKLDKKCLRKTSPRDASAQSMSSTLWHNIAMDRIEKVPKFRGDGSNCFLRRAESYQGGQFTLPVIGLTSNRLGCLLDLRRTWQGHVFILGARLTSSMSVSAAQDCIWKYFVGKSRHI